MSKNKDLKNELMVLENIERDSLFKANLTLDKIKELSATIFQCIQEDYDDKRICRLLQISQSQLEMIRQSPQYHESIHQHDNDAEQTRILLRSHKIPVIQALVDKAKSGNVNACKEVLDRIDAKENTGNDILSLQYELAKRLGIVSDNDLATKKIQEAKQITDGMIEAEIVEEDEFEDETAEEKKLRLLKKRLGLP